MITNEEIKNHDLEALINFIAVDRFRQASIFKSTFDDLVKRTRYLETTVSQKYAFSFLYEVYDLLCMERFDLAEKLVLKYYLKAADIRKC